MGGSNSVELPSRLTFDFKTSVESSNSNLDFINELYYTTPIDGYISNGCSTLDKNKFVLDPKCALTYDVHRYTYLSNAQNCCLKNILSDGADYCNPASSSIYTSDFCDNFIKQYCLEQNSDVCYQWIETYLTRKNDAEVINKLSSDCSEDYNNSKCHAFLIALKKINTPEYAAINNNIINSENNKKYNFCLNPPQNILEEAKKKELSLDCWYPGCTNLEYWKLTTDQVEARRRCTVAFCSINLGELDVDPNSTISINCSSGVNNNKVEAFNSLIFRDEKYQTLMNIPDISFLIIIILIFLLFLFQK